MKIRRLHAWKVTPAQAVRIQQTLRAKIIRTGDLGTVRTVAGIDISVKDDRARAAVVVLSYPELAPIEQAVASQAVPFPYVPGLLSFREIPSILAAYKKLHVKPDLIMVDGQGIAHPRRFGLASHLGLLLGMPSIGCAKTRLVGTYAEPRMRSGAMSYLYDRGEIIGAAVRTKHRTNVVYVSIGHRIELKSAVRWVLKCTRGYRLPEPTRQAHRAAGAWGRAKIGKCFAK